MTFEAYKEELDKRMEALSWRQQGDLRDRLGTPAHDLMVQASNDRDVTLEQFEKLARTFYGW